ncbi:hypothetical protein HHI36_004397 [Cryptolaemus montrouzieri]|uniref:RRM domain-containing protein n=1 Tax=Cryptolaemus montrouzieri TaxID=559131 RepID=A0ABD2NRF2_9CUCU
MIQEQQSIEESSEFQQSNIQSEIESENIESVNKSENELNLSEAKTVECSSASDGETKNVESVETNGDHQTENTKDAEVDDDQAEEGEIRESKSDEENENYGDSGKVKKPAMRIKLRRDSLLEAMEKLHETGMQQQKKIKWNPVEHRCLKLAYSDLLKLHLEDFKTLSPDLKLADEKDVKLEDTYKPKVADLKVVRERKVSMDTNAEETDRPEYSKQSSTVSSDDQETTNIIALNRKISIVDDAASKLRPPPSPAKQPVSPILFISNLVRPFTIKQLKELLERTGTIKEDGFWTDRIKSKCFVHYESTEEAEATRNALHGVNWPIGNGKKLVIEYSTEEEMEKAKNPPTQPVAPPVHVTPPRAKTPQKENTEPEHEPRNGDRRGGERKRKDSERTRERGGRAAPTREWDVGKESRRERSRSRSRERKRNHGGRRSITPLEDFIARKQRKLEDSVPQKLMDDLFQRTKTMPCIYWQPLSPEEISIKQQQRLSRMEEHKRRLEENSRNRGAREPGRGAFRRRYD